MALYRLSPHPYRSAMLALLAMALVTAGMLSLETMLHRSALERQRTAVTDRLAVISAKLEGRLAAGLNLSRVLAAVVSTRPDIGTDELNALSTTLMAGNPLIRSLAVARDNTLVFVHPLAGNEAAVGMNYMANPGQRDTVLRAIRTRSTVVAGPLELVQGGIGLVSRSPIFVGPAGGRYWGIAAAVLHVNALLRDAGADDPASPIAVSIRGEDGLGADGATFFGDEEIQRNQPVTLDVRLADGNWRLYAIPRNGWYRAAPEQNLLRLGGAALALAIGIGVFFWSDSNQRVRALALTDPLTGLPNRALLGDRISQALIAAGRQGQLLAVLHLDLDDFKPVNDAYGHRAGDAALVAVAERVHGAVRRSDTVARIGGDEFVVVLAQIARNSDAMLVAEKIVEMVRQPIDAQGHAVTLSASVGIAIYPQDGSDVATLVSRADQAMYRAKQAGKNRAAQYGAPLPVSSVSA
jgi:diguanylate cyclase (GGDEF)-like protein